MTCVATSYASGRNTAGEPTASTVCSRLEWEVLLRLCYGFGATMSARFRCKGPTSGGSEEERDAKMSDFGRPRALLLIRRWWSEGQRAALGGLETRRRARRALHNPVAPRRVRSAALLSRRHVSSVVKSPRASRSRSATHRRIAIASRVACPCRYRPWAGPL